MHINRGVVVVFFFFCLHFCSCWYFLPLACLVLSIPVEGVVAYTHGWDRGCRPVCYNAYGVFRDRAVYDSVLGDAEKLGRFLWWRVQVMERGVRMLQLRPCGVNAIMQPYKPDYTAPPRANPDETTIDISGGWTVNGTLDLHDPRVLAMAAAQRQFLEAEYDDFSGSNASGAAFCRSATLIFMALLLLRHALVFTNGDEEDDDVSVIFALFLLRVAGFLLPCYIMAWAISILQRRRQRQEEAEVAAREVAYILQEGQGRGLHITIAPPESPTAPQQDPHQ